MCTKEVIQLQIDHHYHYDMYSIECLILLTNETMKYICTSVNVHIYTTDRQPIRQENVHIVLQFFRCASSNRILYGLQMNDIESNKQNQPHSICRLVTRNTRLTYYRTFNVTHTNCHKNQDYF